MFFVLFSAGVILTRLHYLALYEAGPIGTDAGTSGTRRKKRERKEKKSREHKNEEEKRKTMGNWNRRKVAVEMVKE